MGNLIGRGVVLLAGLWLIVGGGSCVLTAGVSLFALPGLGMGALGFWMIRAVFMPAPVIAPKNSTTPPSPPSEEEK